MLAPAAMERNEDARTKTRLEARGKLFGTLPEELKKLIGQTTAKQGIQGIFDMLQYPRLNKRFVYAIFEAFLIQVREEEKKKKK